MVVFIVQRGNHLCQNINGIGHCATIKAGVQVAVRASYFYFYIAQAAQAGGNGRGVRLPNNAGIGNKDDIAGKFIFGCALQTSPGFRLPTSSSPSIINFTLQGSYWFQFITSRAFTCIYIWPLSSQAPRAYILPSFITGSKGGESHSS